ncbi:anaerobic ribonucleoside-triphosphate reductase activating protein [Collinsella sp. An2]|uniref:anaerobic ribonucleoside-triphosphate reductase activating protein n=1 Tax=Collinsella sp. An2 TaxID=1965585 RepID=UPI000B384F59|nr:anaerobic ribonucleoside-triphosphate reductase activating protein [Collinsella sp. An2]OUP08922.1 anaerobic ribonucleoside-triphosphate reductase activating protein [Collinsella sp. An2]
MNYAEIKYFDIANGEGVRTSLFVSGCRRGCPGCFNSGAWSFKAGEPFTREVEDKIIDSLDHEFCDGLTILGGEPMEPENQAGLVDFVERVRERFPRGEHAGGAPAKTIWCFTGDTLDELMSGAKHHTDVTDRLLDCIDVLVDGPWVQELYDISLRFHGSSNQRLIDLNATRAAAAERGCSLAEAVQLWQDEQIYSTHSM